MFCSSPGESVTRRRLTTELRTWSFLRRIGTAQLNQRRGHGSRRHPRKARPILAVPHHNLHVRESRGRRLLASTSSRWRHSGLVNTANTVLEAACTLPFAYFLRSARFAQGRRRISVGRCVSWAECVCAVWFFCRMAGAGKYLEWMSLLLLLLGWTSAMERLRRETARISRALSALVTLTHLLTAKS
jgi:hypothetical protein